jgi:hypothetical protein
VIGQYDSPELKANPSVFKEIDAHPFSEEFEAVKNLLIAPSELETLTLS